jgi:hypothetical protein
MSWSHLILGNALNPSPPFDSLRSVPLLYVKLARVEAEASSTQIRQLAQESDRAFLNLRIIANGVLIRVHWPWSWFILQ